MRLTRPLLPLARFSAGLVLGVWVLVAGCGTSPETTDPGSSGSASSETGSSRKGTKGTRAESLSTGAQGYSLELTLPKKARSKTPVELEVRISDPTNRSAPITDASLVVTARPAGKNVPATRGIVEGSDGVFRTDLSLTRGTWEVYLDVTRGALTERGQIVLEVR